jgi:hypothetical protein
MVESLVLFRVAMFLPESAGTVARVEEPCKRFQVPGLT